MTFGDANSGTTRQANFPQGLYHEPASLVSSLAPGSSHSGPYSAKMRSNTGYIPPARHLLKLQTIALFLKATLSEPACTKVGMMQC